MSIGRMLGNEAVVLQVWPSAHGKRKALALEPKGAYSWSSASGKILHGPSIAFETEF